jgi:hypothetical protein
MFKHLMLQSLFLSLFIVFILSGCQQSTGIAVIEGTYLLVKDSDGTAPKNAAVVTISFKGSNAGTVSMAAVQPGETVTDTGTFSVIGSNITIKFKEMEWEAAGQPFQLDGCNLTLPFKALGGSKGPGTSTWMKKSPSCAK